MATRQEMWDRIGGEVDVLVVGGGITGCGIARDAAARGLSVALVEMHDIAFGTSSRSSKLVHGGLRYLEQYEFNLVFEAVSERRILMDIAPHLVNPLGFLFPVYKGSRQPLWLINTGMWLYDGLSLFRSPKMHRNLSFEEICEHAPELRREGLRGSPLYYDCATDDARLSLENALDAVRAGAVVATYSKLSGFEHDSAGRVIGAHVTDQRTGETAQIRAGVVINATGPWTDRTLAMTRRPPNEELLRPTKGVHIVVDAARLALEHAVVLFHPEDGRVMFAIPWGDRTYIGTTDTDFDGDPAHCDATSDDVDYLIAATNDYFPSVQLVRDDVIATWAGLRPLMRPVGRDASVSESAVSREHQIVVGEDGVITIAGGKLTTYRRMANEVVDTAVKFLRLADHLPDHLMPPNTDREPLPGAVGWPDDDDAAFVVSRVVEAAGGALESDTAEHLVDTYGMRAIDIARRVRSHRDLGERLVPGRPEILAQVDWSVFEELATEVADVLVRRTQLYYRDHDQGLSAAPRVADRMAELLDWDAATRDASLASYRQVVAESRAWQGGDASATAPDIAAKAEAPISS